MIDDVFVIDAVAHGYSLAPPTRSTRATPQRQAPNCMASVGHSKSHNACAVKTWRRPRPETARLRRVGGHTQNAMNPTNPAQPNTISTDCT